jgi:hypothetical protein
VWICCEASGGWMNVPINIMTERECKAKMTKKVLNYFGRLSSVFAQRLPAVAD